MHFLDVIMVMKLLELLKYHVSELLKMFVMIYVMLSESTMTILACRLLILCHIGESSQWIPYLEIKLYSYMYIVT